MSTQELRDQTVDELVAKEYEVKGQLFQLVNELKVTKKLEKPHLVRKLKKDVARIKTIINQKKNGEALRLKKG